ncbi:hypothetical protein GCM10023175_28280 [Pseudonocardia xishanensis]|uniref:UspA domain-containing protein n=1 Tax=Pseudonocardia xishanensis TaxID=630995 RepID=A0ABP8RRN5_9PSEU
MSYRTIVVGTDGSETSMLAVDRVAGLAADGGGRLVVATAYRAGESGGAADDALKGESHLVHGSRPAEDDLRAAADRAGKLLPGDRIDSTAVQGEPIEVLVDVARSQDAGVIVVGNRGIGTLTGGLLGSVPSRGCAPRDGRRGDRPHVLTMPAPVPVHTTRHGRRSLGGRVSRRRRPRPANRPSCWGGPIRTPAPEVVKTFCTPGCEAAGAWVGVEQLRATDPEAADGARGEQVALVVDDLHLHAAQQPTVPRPPALQAVAARGAARRGHMRSSARARRR